MPTLWAHRNYFANSSTVVAPVLAASEGGYPRWQASVIAVGSFPGQLQLVWDRFVAWVRTWLGTGPAPTSHDEPVPNTPQVISATVAAVIEAPAVVQARKVKARPRTLALLKWARKAKAEPPPASALAHANGLLQHPAYPFALEAVKKTATTLGFNRPEAWQGLSRQMKASPGRAENIFRHMRACEITRATSPSTLTNPDCNLLVELAYHEWARRQ